jgi:ATP phosphoribosyltransferase
VANIRFGLPRGKTLEEPTLALFAKAGLAVSLAGRAHSVPSEDPELECLLVRAEDMPRFVHSGVVDAGITGLDWIYEAELDIVQVADLWYTKQRRGSVQWVLAVHQESEFRTVSDLAGRRVATELVSVTNRYFTKRGMSAIVEFSHGATEAKASTLVDAVVDVNETGASLAANQLRVLDVVFTSNTKIIANQGSWANTEKRRKINDVAVLLRASDAGMGAALLRFVISPSELTAALGMLTLECTPTLLETIDGHVAVECVVSRADLRRAVLDLRAKGAKNLFELPTALLLV